MLDATLKQQLSQYLAMLREPIELVASLGDDAQTSAKSAETRELLTTIASLSDKVTATFDGTDARKPSFLIRRASNPDAAVRFAGLPLGHEFTSLVLALLWAGGHPPRFPTKCWSRSARSTVTTISRCTSRSRATTAPTWCRR